MIAGAEVLAVVEVYEYCEAAPLPCLPSIHFREIQSSRILSWSVLIIVKCESGPFLPFLPFLPSLP